MLPLRPLAQRSIRTYLPNLLILNGLHDEDKSRSSITEEASHKTDQSLTRKVFETTPIVPKRNNIKDEQQNSTEAAEDTVIVSLSNSFSLSALYKMLPNVCFSVRNSFCIAAD